RGQRRSLALAAVSVAGRGGGAVGRHLLGGPLEVVGGTGAVTRCRTGGTRGAAARAAHTLIAPARRPADQLVAPADEGPGDLAGDRPCRRDQKDQAEDVADEAGSDQERSADRYRDAVGDLFAGEAPLRERQVEPPPRGAALVTQKQRADQRIREQDCQ